MDDTTVPLPSHVTWRGTTLQYVRRVPDDVADQFGRKRIQISLRTREPLAARAKALQLDQTYEMQFQAIRAKFGSADRSIGTETWTLKDWQALAHWLTAARVEEDTLRRAQTATGGSLTSRNQKSPFDFSTEGIFATELNHKKQGESQTAEAWFTARGDAVNRYLAKLAIRLRENHPRFLIIAAYLQKADIAAADMIMDRERGKHVDYSSPEEIEGPWRSVPRPDSPYAASTTQLTVDSVAAIPTHSDTFEAIQEEWMRDRTRNNKPVEEHGQTERLRTIQRFSSHVGIATVQATKREHLIAYRNHRIDKDGASAATVNKEISVISSLLKFARGLGRIDFVQVDGLYVSVPEGDDDVEPFSAQELQTIFGHRIYTEHGFSSEKKACGNLQYWLPLISLLHGMISSEIMQLGPDTVGPHPDHPEIFCFNVTTANSRRTKTIARRRYVPIHPRLIELGLLRVVEDARSRSARFLWETVEDLGVSESSKYFSDWFSRHLRKTLKISDGQKKLYSLRHTFKDELMKAGVPKEHRDLLMGHAESGTGRRYGTKRKPIAVPITLLRDAIQSLPIKPLAIIKTFAETN